MIILATREVYTISVTGDKETKAKLNAIQTMAEQTKKKMEALSRINVSPNVHLNDQASSKLDALEAKLNKLKNYNINLKADTEVEAKDKASETIGKIRDKINGVLKAGAQIAIGFTAKGIETSIKNYAEYEKTLANVKAISNATGSEMKEMDLTAKKLGSSTNWSAISLADAEKTLVQSGMSVKDTLLALSGVLNLATAGGIDLGAAADAASTILTGFSLKGSDSAHVADVLASSASQTKSDLGELADTMKYMTPVGSALGISFEDTAVAAGLLSGQNIKGSQAATMLKQTIGKLSSPTKEAAEMMKKYNINAYDAQNKMKPLSGVVENLNSSLGNLTDKQKQEAISAIFGVDNMPGILALMNQGGDSLVELSKRAQNAKGLASEVVDIKMDTLAGQWDRLKAAATTMSVTLGEKLVPYAKQFVDWLIEKMPVIEEKIVGIVDYVSNHVEDVKALAGAVALLGGALVGLTALGNLANAFTGITSFMGMFKGAGVAAETAGMAGGLGELAGGLVSLLPVIAPIAAGIGALGLIISACEARGEIMNKTVDTSTEELSGFQKIINSLTGHTIKSREELESAGFVYKKFGDNIGTDFQKKIEGSTNAIGEFSLFVSNINFDHVLTASETADFNKRVDNLASSAIETIKNKQKESQIEMTKLFMSDDSYLDDTEKSVLQALSNQSQAQIDKVTADQKKIHDIYDGGMKIRGYLTDDEKKQIKDRYIEISQIELEAATEAKTKQEQSYLKHDFINRANHLSDQDASNLLKDQKSKIDEQKIKSKTDYDVQIDTLTDLASTQEGPAKDNTEALIKKFTEKRDQLDQYYDNQLRECFATVEKENPNLKDTLNKYTFDVLNNNDKDKQSKLQTLENTYEGLANIKQDGTYKMRNVNNGEEAEITVRVDSATKEIIGAYAQRRLADGTYTDQVAGGYSNELAMSTKKTGDEYANLVSTGESTIRNLTGAKIYDNGEIISDSGNGWDVGTLDAVTTAADGTVQGILKVNNTPIEVRTNKDGIVTDIDYIINQINRIPQLIDLTAKPVRITNDADGWRIIRGTGNKDTADTGNDGASNPAKNSVVYIGNKTTQTDSSGNASQSNPLDSILRPTYPNYTGTNNGRRGINSVAERGFEIIMGKEFRWFNGGEKVLNHKKSKEFLANQLFNEPFQVKQGQYQVFQPQMQVAGAGGVNVGDIQVSVNGNQDANVIVQDVVQVVGYKLKEALTNIKK